MAWTEQEETVLNRDTLLALFNNEIGCIRVENFLTQEMCKNVVDKVQEIGFEYYNNVKPSIGRIGLTQFEYADLSRKEYFELVNSVNKKLLPVNNIFNKVLDYIVNNTSINCEIAYENDLKAEYFAGLVRQINKALLHIDFAPRDAVGWNIAKANSQIAWNVFLQLDNDGGGESIIYNRAWEHEDDKLYKIENSYGYHYDVVKNKEYVVCNPKLGELVLHNSRNYHEVNESFNENKRITMSSFGGKLDDKIIFWN